MTKRSVFFAAAWVLAGGLLAESPAATISDIQLQSNFNGATGAGQSAPIAAAAFNFALQPQLLDITSVSIRLTIIDGDTGLGSNGVVDTPYPPDGAQYGDDDFDVNSLGLRLDGIDLGQGLLLNGFNDYDPSFALADKDYVTLTITGTPANMSALLTALQDGQLVATIYDTTGLSQSNGFRLPNQNLAGTQQIFATLSLTGTAVPEPGSVALCLVGLSALALYSRRRRA